ncbi:hypothetical protein B484DRAFT_427824 [Ochromonadaceae sp. CCMP2298]|nr:hypothetical protein B484DRAFT_427824 [Ochromonadaceae sp. CCMP2298]
MLGCALLLSASAYVWWSQVIPQKRTELAISKRSGDVREYLEGLRGEGAGGVGGVGEGAGVGGIGGFGVGGAGAEANADGEGELSGNLGSGNLGSGNLGNRRFEQWLFTDWVQKLPTAKGSRGSTARPPKSAALPFLKKAKWNSGDNPILVAFASIISCGAAASLAERAGQGGP